MREGTQIRIKKLALAHRTGWEYMPGSEEAGSVLTDIFLEMMEENKKRYNRIWEKHRTEFLTAAPEGVRTVRKLKTGLAIKATGEGHGKWLDRDTEAYMVPEQGELLHFTADTPIQLTAARLQYAVYQKGLSAWLSYEKNSEEEVKELKLYQPAGMELAHPAFEWEFWNLCNGRAAFDFEVNLQAAGPPPGRWTVSDGRGSYPLKWRQSGQNSVLWGETTAFSENLEDTMYKLRLDVSPEEELTEEWLTLLCRGFSFREQAQEREPDLCVTDEGACGGQRLLPFGREPAIASCCYLACDRVLAVKDREITLQFTEGCEKEEKLPPSHPAEYTKLYKKYPWLQASESVQEWSVKEVVWEYFNGNLWRMLPGSGDWKTGCAPGETVRRVFRWKRPEDMQPCAVEGEEHFYIRLRLEKVNNAYAAYYRKEIPVLEKISFAIGERLVEPVSQKLPEAAEAGKTKMLLGFDREITPYNRWYTDGGSLCFFAEQIKGRKVLFEREAYWVEMEPAPPQSLTCFFSNYEEIRQRVSKEQQTEEEAQEISERMIPSGTPFSLITQSMGVLDAVSVYDADYDGAESLVPENGQWTGHYFTSFGRLVTSRDVELLLQEEYPFLQVTSCTFQEDEGELIIKLAQRETSEPEAAEKKLPEIRKYLESAIHHAGVLWLADCHVRCSLSKTQKKNGRGNEPNAKSIVTG